MITFEFCGQVNISVCILNRNHSLLMLRMKDGESLLMLSEDLGRVKFVYIYVCE